MYYYGIHNSRRKIIRAKNMGGFLGPFRADEIDYVTMKAWGAKIVRYHCFWNAETTLPGWNITNMTDVESWISTVIFPELDNAVLWCKKYGMKLVIDFCHTPGGAIPAGQAGNNTMLMFLDETYYMKFLEIWQRIATRYKNESCIYGYEIVSEPILKSEAGTAYISCHDLQLNIANAIRAIDTTVPIIYSPVNYTFLGYSNVELLDEISNVIYTYHFYKPMRFTHYGSIYTDVEYTYPGRMDDGVYWDKAKLKDVFFPIRYFQQEHNAKIFIGEFAAARWCKGAAQWLQDCCEIFREYKWNWCYCCYGPSPTWGLHYANGTYGDNNALAISDTDRKITILAALKK